MWSRPCTGQQQQCGDSNSVEAGSSGGASDRLCQQHGRQAMLSNPHSSGLCAMQKQQKKRPPPTQDILSQLKGVPNVHLFCSNMGTFVGCAASTPAASLTCGTHAALLRSDSTAQHTSQTSAQLPAFLPPNSCTQVTRSPCALKMQLLAPHKGGER
jgi:hypothetical protein